MLNISYWSSKGMVKVPDLSGLSITNAIAAIQNAHLVPVDGGSTDTQNQALDNTIVSQLPNADDLVDYETNVSYISYNYVPAPPFFPFFPYFPSFPSCTYHEEYTYGGFVYGECVNGSRTVTATTRYVTITNTNCSTSTRTDTGSYPQASEACTANTYYWCCSDGVPGSGQYSNSAAAAQAATNACILQGSSLSGGVYTTPQNCL